MGTQSTKTLVNHMDGTLDLLSNKVDHLYNNQQPYRPVVINSTNVPGLRTGNSNIVSLVDFPQAWLDIDLKTQFRLCVEQGLNAHANEFVDLCARDTCSIAALHFGQAPMVGDRWIRKNGNGIAVPGCYPSSLKSSEGMRR
jgi:hypothetical protein